MLRQGCGLSVREVAKKLNKSDAAYRRIENGTVKLVDEDMLRLKELYHCRLEDLVEYNRDTGRCKDEVQQAMAMIETMQQQYETNIARIMAAFMDYVKELSGER